MVERAQVIVKGIVQGVGFRPFVFNLAESLGLKGYVTNTGAGVLIEVEGEYLRLFLERLSREAPPLSRVTDISVTRLPCYGYSDFSIQASIDCAEGHPFTLVSPDVSVCDDCVREFTDPADRRYLYPFINCTNCGPRFSITNAVPYDRPNTTMASFGMCPDCLREYHDPRDRRFHAQPNACPKCGPTVEFRVRGAERRVKGTDAIRETITLLKQGGIVAVKGIGGFHIACDAVNNDAVRMLRERKRKSNKPFAVMAPTAAAAQSFCSISKEEEMLLQSNRRPIVLLKKQGGGLSDDVAPNNQYVGVMLPYTPLHYLLFHHSLVRGQRVVDSHFTALVMTSGNLSEEPIIRDNDDALKKLAHIADGFLLHNRDIFMRVDDTVIRLRSENTAVLSSQSKICFIRRSRGYAPDPIALHDDGPEVLGCGADLKNTFTLTKGKFAIPSQHIGDMENYETVRFYEESLENLKAVYRADPKVIIHDLHPEYLSTKWAIECGVRSAEFGVKTYGIQHHYAHIGSVMAEHGLKDKVIGVALDGTGYGTDGNLWGGEFLIAGIDGFERAGQFQYVPLPGGEAAIRDPWRTAVSYIAESEGAGLWESLEIAGFKRKYGKDLLEKVIKIAASRELSPLASGAGRLFDAVSALLGICDRNTFEGEAAMALESFTCDGIEDEYPFELREKKEYTVVQFSTTFKAILSDMAETVSTEKMSTRFHNTVISAIRRTVGKITEQSGITDVALSGGTFQNRYILNKTLTALSSDGMQVYTNLNVPCNDGGISLGQAYLVRERLKECGIRSAESGV